jgi:endo-alpha-N-acetylgalactosaminidase
VCKVFDTSRNLLAAVSVVLSDNGFTVKTASGVQVVYPRSLLARVDFSQDKLRYLSDLEPLKVVENSNIGLEDHYRRDKSLDNGPLRLGKETYAKGLALHAYAELVYDLGGQFKEFKAVLGVDPKVGVDPANVKIVVEGDGRSLFTDNIKRDDKPRPITVDVKNVKQLRLVVSSNSLFDLGDHLNLGDAKVTK